jgi:hypothetical protein
MAWVHFKASLLRALGSGVLGLGMALGAGVAHAQAQGYEHRLPTTRPVFGIGFTGGGDYLATVPFDNGTVQNIYAGRFLHLFLGLEHQIAPGYFFRGTLGYHTDSISDAYNNTVSFSRLPLEFSTHFYVADRVTLGLGARKSLWVSLDGNGAGLPIPMTSNLGGLVQMEYELSPEFSLAMRLVHETFQLNSTGMTVDGSHAGMYFNVVF